MNTDLRVELAVPTWTEVTQYTRVSSPVTISRGRPDEAGKVTPSSCALTFDDDGRFTPSNPQGAYFGSIGRNTRLRVSVGAAADAYGRTVASGWGTADSGHTWLTVGAGGTVNATDWSVSSGKGVHSIPAASAYRASYLDGFTVANVDVVATVDPGVAAALGGSWEPANLMLRVSGTQTYYLARLVITTAGLLQLELRRHDVAETLLAGPLTVAGLLHGAGATWRVRAQIEGATLRMKVWAATGGEPASWQLSTSDPDPLPAGSVGVRSGVAAGNTNPKPLVFRYDDLEVRRPRAMGEVATWTPRWNLNHKDRTVPVKATGITRRLGQGGGQQTSAPSRLIDASGPVVHYPMEQGELVGTLRAAVGVDMSVLPFVLGDPPVKFTKQDVAPWLPPTVRTKQGYGKVPVSMPGFTTQWAWDALFISGGTTVWGGGIYVYDTQGAFDFVLNLFGPDDPGGTPNVISVNPPGGTLTSVAMASIFDETVHHLRLAVQQSGSNTNWQVYVDGVQRLSGTYAHFLVQLGQLQVAWSEGLAWQHVALWTTPPALADAVTAAFGHNGESAGRRMERLCGEEGVPFAGEGDLDATEPMGPQGSATLVQLLDECAAADLGTLYEPAGDLGLAYRTRASLYNQPTRLTLDYAAEQVAAPLDPVDDDQATRNDITAKRREGGEYRAQLTTGALSTLAPPDGVGRYDTTVAVNVQTDGQLVDLAGWLLHLGTVDETRYPKVTAHVSTLPAAVAAAALDLGVDDRLLLVNLAAALVYDDVDLLARGYTEVIRHERHTITWSCAPSSPYRVAVLDTDRLDSDTSTLAAGVTSSATSLSVAFTGARWTTDAAQMPIPLLVGGEEMSATAISGTSSPQTFTVTRSVNGVVKSHSADAEVHVAPWAVAVLAM